ncbi:MAG TPA: BlaI/MecI/CopY family transcriptional regulator [Candidatus Woesebacteria bacterium]|nr:BlaI/MecI/CopY family transcriptional regulator [Candidatus Woesebacteria bacterium]HPR99371.1 BlaI/MecI/CopY family transcriptional regulator [Candidatus Woesebacteria bacterium]
MAGNYNCNKKYKTLGSLEQKVMNTLWESSGPLNSSQVLAKVNGGHAYTTIMTVLKRMTDKKLLKRELEGNTYLYQPLYTKAVLAPLILSPLFHQLFESYGDHVLAVFNQVTKELKILS